MKSLNSEEFMGSVMNSFIINVLIYYLITGSYPWHDVNKEYVNLDSFCTEYFSKVTSNIKADKGKLYLEEGLACLDQLDYQKTSPEYQNLKESYQIINTLDSQETLPKNIVKSIKLNNRKINLGNASKTTIPSYSFLIAWLVWVIVLIW